jgi:regulator of protease activity HflC (stomatin/prohibitin superfamily)
MFDKLLDLIITFGEQLLPFFVVKEYQEAVVLRFGHFNSVKKTGIYFKVPFADETILQHTVVTTLNCSAQSLVTLDRKELTVESVVKYRIDDVKKYILEIFDATDAIQDITQSVIKKQIMTKTLEEIYDNDLDTEITRKVRAEVRKYGITVEQITLITLGQIKSYRLIGELPGIS